MDGPPVSFTRIAKGPSHMTSKYLLVFASLTVTLWSQRVTDRRSAEIRGGDGDGKCTIEVVVDDVAEIEINGRNASIRTISGGPASFRRFQCNQEMPTRPNDFRFKGIDGRGRQNLVRQPDSGPAVIRIEDPKGGSEGYTFDIFWRGGTNGGFNSGRYGNDRNNNDRYNNGRGGYNNGRDGYNNGNNRYDNGGYNNGRYGNNGTVNFQGGRNGSGSYEDRNGNRRRLDSARVNINNSGNVDVSFDTDRGRISFSGQVERRDGNRISARVNGSGMNGLMEIELHNNNNNVRNINMNSIRLNWSN